MKKLRTKTTSMSIVSQMSKSENWSKSSVLSLLSQSSFGLKNTVQSIKIRLLTTITTLVSLRWPFLISMKMIFRQELCRIERKTRTWFIKDILIRFERSRSNHQLMCSSTLKMSHWVRKIWELFKLKMMISLIILMMTIFRFLRTRISNEKDRIIQSQLRLGQNQRLIK